ncbi:WD40-repeat-containing domain [Pseudocohnilembus persalinus]|uniref:WD40-repeat-containing domain n=1 Tax=Pseudocohnilembus persalinus TaxID=266149 RepID=A0A0V0QMN1_PSEPJ|nr:WD40-repeat-containing domain [Pseudocohnilembus persalinus]|eukprot:KRX03492.1 WD40-repeat-containing domain [Pseudocohnilembus persalinus]
MNLVSPIRTALIMIENQTFILGSEDCTLKVYDLNKYSMEQILTDHSKQSSILRKIDNQQFASGGLIAGIINFKNEINCIISSSYDKKLIISSLNQDKYNIYQDTHKYLPVALVKMKNEYFSSMDEKGTIKIWQIQKQRNVDIQNQEEQGKSNAFYLNEMPELNLQKQSYIEELYINSYTQGLCYHEKSDTLVCAGRNGIINVINYIKPKMDNQNQIQEEGDQQIKDVSNQKDENIDYLKDDNNDSQENIEEEDNEDENSQQEESMNLKSEHQDSQNQNNYTNNSQIQSNTNNQETNQYNNSYQNNKNTSNNIDANTDNNNNNNQNQSNTENQNPGTGEKPRKRYSVITQEVREKFIERVLSRQVTIKAAAKEFGIKFSTSKAILQTYKREGRTCKKKTRQRNNPTRIVPSTLPSEPNIYGNEDITEHNNNDYNNNNQVDPIQQAQKAEGSYGNNQQQQPLNQKGGYATVQNQQPQVVQRSGAYGQSGFMNKFRFGGRGLQINTNLNINTNNNIKQNQYKINDEIKEQFPNPFDSESKSILSSTFRNCNNQDRNWDFKRIEIQLKKIDVEQLKSQAKTQEGNVNLINDFNYNTYFSDVKY